MATLTVDDFVVLGRTVPEESRTYGQRICMAGYSEELNQFLRIYPLLLPIGESADSNRFQARHKYAVALRRNPKDTRTESWRVQDEKSPTSTPWDRAPEVTKAKVLSWLEKKRVDSILVLNQCRLSLGVVRVRSGQWQGVAVPRETPKASEEQKTLFEDLNAISRGNELESLIDKVRFAPYIHFDDSAGHHELQIREWGAYLLLAQTEYASNPEALWKAPGYRSEKDLYLVVGNMNNHRNNWLVIKTFEADAPEGPNLFDGFSDDQAD